VIVALAGKVSTPYGALITAATVQDKPPEGRPITPITVVVPWTAALKKE
jgi:hypothetical protein